MFLYLRTLLLVASVIIAGSAEAQMRRIEILSWWQRQSNGRLCSGTDCHPRDRGSRDDDLANDRQQRRYQLVRDRRKGDDANVAIALALCGLAVRRRQVVPFVA